MPYVFHASLYNKTPYSIWKSQISPKKTAHSSVCVGKRGAAYVQGATGLNQ